jgi:hypothetical protein
MKKSILVLLVATSFITCSKNNISPMDSESKENPNVTNDASVTSKIMAPTVLCYVTNASAGNYLVKFDALTGALISNTIITGLNVGEKVLGGIARRRSATGAYEYFITTCNTFALSAPVFQRKIDITTSIVPAGFITLTSTGNTFSTYKNYLLENAPSLSYYYKSAGVVTKGTTFPTLPTAITGILFGGKDGSICFGPNNLATSSYANIGQSTVQGNVYSGITFPTIWSAATVNIYTGSLSKAYHCLTSEDGVGAKLYSAYNGLYGANHTLIASATLPSLISPALYTANFPSGTGGAVANISDIEVVY